MNRKKPFGRLTTATTQHLTYDIHKEYDAVKEARKKNAQSSSLTTANPKMAPTENETLI